MTPTPTDTEYHTSEQVAHAMLKLIADRPGTVGRSRCARIVGGYSVPHRDQQEAAELACYALPVDWPIKQLVALVEALTSGGLIAASVGPRPTLALTRAGHRALEALEAIEPAGSEARSW
jgi:hypothetical protein